MTIKTILFDLDGTLLNTNELIKKSFEHTFDKFNVPYTEKELKEYNGPPLMDTFLAVLPEKAEELEAEYRKFNWEFHEKYVTLFPDTLETMEKLTDRGIKIAIVTNKIREVTLLGMRQTGLINYFSEDRIMTLSDVEKAKPDPEGILRIMEVLKSNPESTLMVGDSHFDILAGQRAKVKTAGVAWTERGEDYLKSYNPTYMIDRLPDLLKLL